MSPAELCVAGDELQCVVGDTGLSVLAELFPWDLQVEGKTGQGPQREGGALLWVWVSPGAIRGPSSPSKSLGV